MKLYPRSLAKAVVTERTACARQGEGQRRVMPQASSEGATFWKFCHYDENQENDLLWGRLVALRLDDTGFSAATNGAVYAFVLFSEGQHRLKMAGILKLLAGIRLTVLIYLVVAMKNSRRKKKKTVHLHTV